MTRFTCCLLSFAVHAACDPSRPSPAGDDGGVVDAPPALDQTLVVRRTGTGTGDVTSSPAGIDCGGDCSETYPPGTVVTLDAVPDAQSTFTGWSGACTATNRCEVSMTQLREVTATFALRPFELTVEVTGSGTVSSSPSGITCPGTCTASFVSGTQVTLTPAAAAGSVFTGWSGACSGMGACQVTVTAAATLTAMFQPILTVETLHGYSGTDTHVSLGSSTHRACFLAGSAGQFSQGLANVRVYVSAGEWFLDVIGQADGYAQCVTWPAEAGITVSTESSWTQGQAAVNLGSTMQRLCGLTRMAGRFQGGGELIRTRAEGGVWYLDGHDSNLGASAGAYCLAWPASLGVSYTDESLWAQGQQAVNLGPVGQRFCLFTLIVGNFVGLGENVYVHPSGGSWLQYGGSAQQGVASRVRCLTAP